MDFAVVVDNAPILLRGFGYTLFVAFATIALSLALAIPLAVIRESKWRRAAMIVAGYSWIARATPALTVLFVTYYGLPVLGIYLEPLTSAIIGLTLVSTGYNLEFVRAGLRAVPAGQIDAAKSLGLTPYRTLRQVILPQAMVVAVPPLVSNMTLMVKGSSLASLVAVSELTGEAVALIASIANEPPVLWAPEFVGIMLVLTLISTAFCWWLWTSILDRVPAWEASLLVLGTPVIAIVCSRAILHEAFSRYEIAGILLIGSGLLLLSFVSWLREQRATTT
ncbi:MAG: amino acid ABC transporter permease [Proteobacteria bacterium]|nr:amino acid ABC transporter permease [Pseudomonadota bacterium]